MFELIPSQYVRSLFENLGFKLTDFNKATIIWNMCGKTHDDKMLALKELAESTTDVVLRNQIFQRIEYENKMLEVTRNNDGKYVYVVLDEDDMYCGFFSEYEMAYRYGMDKAKGNEEKPFRIDKQRIITEEKDFIVKSPGRLNWNLFPESKKIPTQKYDGDPAASVYYTPKGVLQRIWSNEMSKEDEDMVDPYSRERFESQFINIPFEGRVGWQMRDIRDNSVGVLMQDTEGWRRYLSGIAEKNLYVDYFDVQVEVVFLTSQGLWSHEHVNPIYLELDRYGYENENEESKAKARAMEFFSEYWLRKAKDQHKLDNYEKRVIESTREYRDICLEEQAQQEKRKCGVADRAKKVEELII